MMYASQLLYSVVKVGTSGSWQIWDRFGLLIYLKFKKKREACSPCRSSEGLRCRTRHYYSPDLYVSEADKVNETASIPYLHKTALKLDLL
jgi:hypothetical protein